MSVCAFNSLPKAEYSFFFIVAAFSKKSFSGKTYLPDKNSYLSKCLVDKAKILAFVCLNLIETCFSRFYYQFL